MKRTAAFAYEVAVPVFIASLVIAPFALPLAHAAGDANRPSEDELFGTPSGPPPSAANPKAASSPAPSAAGKSAFGSNNNAEIEAPDVERNAFATGEVVENPLQMGGIFYDRLIVSGASGVNFDNTPISSPMQFDAFMDGRPNDRIRAYVDGRLLYDPTRDQYGNTTQGPSFGSTQFSTTPTAPTTNSTATLVPNNPEVVLDQAWVKFDINRVIFVTAGKQHVKWGTGHYWNPTDFLNTQLRDPLLPYDLRLGNSMLKLDIPWESKKTNFYAITLFDNPIAASTLGQLGEALRAETVIGSTEIGLDAVYRGSLNPVYGADVSAPLGPIDVYAEGAMLTGVPTQRYQVLAAPTAGADISTLYSASPNPGPFFQVTLGTSYDFAWEENRQATVGVEYFYNEAGYSTPAAYPLLVFLNQFQPFYNGQHYAALYLTAEGADSLKHTNYTFSTLANLSDSSFISMIDFSWRILTYLTFESYLDAHYGRPGGEFTFSMNTPTLAFNGVTIPAISIPQSLFDLGLSLRVAF